MKTTFAMIAHSLWEDFNQRVREAETIAETTADPESKAALERLAARLCEMREDMGKLSEDLCQSTEAMQMLRAALKLNAKMTVQESLDLVEAFKDWN